MVMKRSNFLSDIGIFHKLFTYSFVYLTIYLQRTTFAVLELNTSFFLIKQANLLEFKNFSFFFLILYVPNAIYFFSQTGVNALDLCRDYRHKVSFPMTNCPVQEPNQARLPT